MAFRDAIVRIALADAHRFELETAAMLRDILQSCADERTRQVIREIIAEEEGHAETLQKAAAGTRAAAAGPPAAEKKDLPSAPGAEAVPGPICDKLRDLLAKEDASVRFYS